MPTPDHHDELNRADDLKKVRANRLFQMTVRQVGNSRKLSYQSTRFVRASSYSQYILISKIIEMLKASGLIGEPTTSFAIDIIYKLNRLIRVYVSEFKSNSLLLLPKIALVFLLIEMYAGRMVVIS